MTHPVLDKEIMPGEAAACFRSGNTDLAEWERAIVSAPG